jgi:hypothetical protein
MGAERLVDHWRGPVLMAGALGALGGMFPVPTITVSISDQSVSDTAISPISASASYVINSDGSVRDHDGLLLETWLDAGAASTFQVRATLTSGSTPGGTLNTWLACSTTREWTVTGSSPVPVGCVLLIELRHATTLVVLDSASVTMSAERTS